MVLNSQRFSVKRCHAVWPSGKELIFFSLNFNCSIYFYKRFVLCQSLSGLTFVGCHQITFGPVFHWLTLFQLGYRQACGAGPDNSAQVKAYPAVHFQRFYDSISQTLPVVLFFCNFTVVHALGIFLKSFGALNKP
jgi:hypothetical protein